jgi:phosphoenolpyruvate synthase/pyruvate phosphate dikinase
MSYVVWLHNGRLDRGIAGGKGASLSDLIAAGFTVPSGFCVTADGYRSFLKSNDLVPTLQEALAAADLATPAGRREAAEAAGTLILSAPLPAKLARAIAEGCEGLAAMAGLACAVRSSAISEDGSAASFAGLYDSYLNVRGTASVCEHVRRCYASLWSERALGYRLRGGVSSDTAAIVEEAMAVVVMGFVPAEASGIAFTAHPVTGARDQVVINASWGLGEAIVSGRVTPDSFVVKKDSLALLEREIFAKELAVYPHPDGGGTIERGLTPDLVNAPSLTDDQAKEVARIAAAVEERYGSPQDLEWGLAAQQIFLLQSRPITTLP